MKTNRKFLIIFHSFLLRMRNVADKRSRGNQNTHFMFSLLAVSLSRPLYAGVLISP